MDNETLKKTALDFLNAHHKMVLTVLDKEGAPNSSLMHYVVDDEFNVYIGTKKGFGKYLALTNDPRVSLAVVQEGIDPLQVVDMQAHAELISDDKTEEAYAFFKSKNQTKHYVQGADDFVMFKFVPKKVRFMDATSGELQMHDLEL